MTTKLSDSIFGRLYYLGGNGLEGYIANAYMQYDGNNPFIFGSKTFELGSKINAIKTDAPYLIDKLELHKHEIWNECLTFLGIDNANTDKKERLILLNKEANREKKLFNKNKEKVIYKLENK